MSAIKDVIDLIQTLSKRTNDRELASELLQILQFIIAIQSEHTAIVSENFELKKNNSELEFQILNQKKTIQSLKEDIKQLQKGSSDDAGGFSSGVVIS